MMLSVRVIPHSRDSGTGAVWSVSQERGFVGVTQVQLGRMALTLINMSCTTCLATLLLQFKKELSPPQANHVSVANNLYTQKVLLSADGDTRNSFFFAL